MNMFNSLITVTFTFCTTAIINGGHWQENTGITYPLPKYTHTFKNELTIRINDTGDIEVKIPQKDPSYWLAPTSHTSAETIAHLFKTTYFSTITMKDIKNLLNAIKAEYPHLKDLYESMAHLNESHTLETHTLRVLEQFINQKQFYMLDNPCYNSISSSIEKVLIAALLLHDIGKPLGVRSKQHEHTMPIVQKALNLWEFSPSEQKLALALIDNDAIGELVQKKYHRKIDKTYEELTQLSNKAQLSLKDYFTLQTLFFVSDATSYYAIKTSAFQENKNKMLVPMHEKFKQLSDMIHQRQKTKSSLCIKSSL